MAQLEEGNVLGGRYLITAHVMTTGEQDQVLQGLDQVLNREVMILVAGPQHASQVATSARELATGEREAVVQVLDLGLTDEATYLIAADTADAQSLLSLVTDHQVYVEPFHTENLGSELFGERRSYEPETYDDDAEYYQELDRSVEYSQNAEAHRPEFLNRISHRLNESLNASSSDEDLITPGQQPRSADGGAAGAGAAAAGAAGAAGAAAASNRDRSATEQTQPQNFDEVVSSAPYEEYDDDYDDSDYDDAPAYPAAAGAAGAAGSSGGGMDGYVYDEDDREERSGGVWRWIAAALLVVVLVGVVIFAFNYLGDSTDEPVADDTNTTDTDDTGDGTGEEPADESPEPEEPTVAPELTGVTRVVPESPNLSSQNDADLPLLIDGDMSTAWHSLSFAQPQFGGFASTMSLVVELAEPAPVNQVTVHNSDGSGGAFNVFVSDEADPAAGTQIGEQQSFSTDGATVSTDGEAVTGQYVIIQVTELPTLTDSSATLPYGLRLAEVVVE